MTWAAGSAVGADFYYQLGMDHSTGRGAAMDFIEAHKWFNIAAMKGSAEAARMRGEIAAEMSATEVAEAQRAARAFLTLH